MVDPDNDQLTTDVLNILREQERANRDKKFQQWCEGLETVAKNSKPASENGLIAQVDLQPYQWIQHALDLLGSRRAAGTVQLASGLEGPDLRTYLPYPVFQMGAEIFLKGMWLYNDERCKAVSSDTYIPPDTRSAVLDDLKKLSKTHDLLEILRGIEQVELYKQDPHITILESLDIITTR